MPVYTISRNAIPRGSTVRRAVGHGIVEGIRQGVGVEAHPDTEWDKLVAWVKDARGKEFVLVPDLVNDDLDQVASRVRYSVPIRYRAEDCPVCIVFPSVDSSFGASMIEGFRATRECPQVLHTVRDRRVGPMGWAHTPRPESPLRGRSWEGFPSLDEMLDKLFANRTINDLNDPRLK